MPVYLPTGAVGNGRVLATLGSAGEIMSFFYPRIDFAQNVHECLPALYVGEPGHGLFAWTFEGKFSHQQHYLPQSNVLVTELNLATPPLKVTLQDFCPPNTDALVRTVTVKNIGDGQFQGAFLHYFDLNLGEAALKQAVRYIGEPGCLIQYFRNIAVAVGGTRPDMWCCGKSIDQDAPGSAKHDMYDGHLNGQPEDIGQVDFALGYHLALSPGQSEQIEILIVAAESAERSCAQFQQLRKRDISQLLATTVQDDRVWLGRRRRVTVERALTDSYQRALLSLKLLYDVHENCFVAAPEFDPHYLRCGGYGYCWPRDATAAALALHRAGYKEYLEGLARWLARTQLPSGRWAQRYWTQGQVGPSWSLREDFQQLDQSASAVHLLATCLLSLPPDKQPTDEPSCWKALKQGAEALAATISEAGWHSPACDLWETYCGSFVYTNAAIFAALQAAARCAETYSKDKLASRWSAVAGTVRQATVGAYNNGYFPRGKGESGWEDPVVDSSTLGLVEPFDLLRPEEETDRAMIESNLRTIQRQLTQPLDGGVGIRRYEGDAYLGGALGCVNTLWAARVCLRLADAYRGEDNQKSSQYEQQACEYLSFVIDHTTPTGLLPELIGTRPDTPYWAAPHSWACGLLVECVLTLDQLRQKS